MTTRLARLAAATLAASVLLPATIASAQIVRIINYSDWNIEYLFLSPTGNRSWGPDQLGAGVLYAGGGWIDIAAACRYYDLRIVDEDADECIVANIHFCNETVTIDNDDLLSCQGDTLAFGGAQGAAATCGLGFELAFVLPPLLWLRGRRRSGAAAREPAS